MTSRTITIAGFCLLLAAAAAVEWRGRRSTSRLMSGLDVVRSVQWTRFGRTATFVVWFWLGWHFLAR